MAGLDLVRVLHRKSTKGSLGWISLLLKSVLSDSLRISCVPLKCTLLTISLSCCVVKRILAMCFADSCSLPLTDSVVWGEPLAFSVPNLCLQEAGY